MAEAFSGFHPVAALHRLLELRGEQCTRQEIKEKAGGAVDLDAMRRILRPFGIEARAVRISAEDISRLELPTLLRQAPESWLVVRAKVNEGYLLEGPDGFREVQEASLADLHDGWALELHPLAPKGLGLWKSILHLVAQNRRALYHVALASIGLQLLALLSPQFTRLAMDRALPEGGHSLLRLVALGMALVALFQAWVGWLRQRTILFLETRLEASLSQHFLSHVLALPFPFLHKRSLGDMLQANSSLDVARNALTERMLGSLLDGVTAPLYLLVMAISMPGPTAAVVGVSAVMVVLVILVGRAQENLQKKEIDAQIRERGFLVEFLKGITTVKAAGAEDSTLQRWMGMLKAEYGLSLRRQRTGLWSDIGLDGLKQALGVAVLIWGGKLVLDNQIQVGSLMAFVQMSTAFLGAILGLAQVYLSLRVLRPQVAKITEYLEVAPEVAVSSSRPLSGPVTLDDVWFRYGPEHPWVLKGFDLHVAPGEKRWIHAPSGFGKSTLLRLIAGLYPPDRGLIRVGGLDPSEAQGQLIYLPQFVQLYGGSILENLRLLSGGADHDRLMAAAEATGLDRIAAALPMGYNTVLPQGGGSLSGGQRQLVALTAVMASNHSLVLLDEAMANLDWMSRDWLRQSEWIRERTVIYVSHEAGLG
jgi:ABC-type bacteriocin/lantibiotic exporter with double-glycine peptidase domain